MAGAVLAGVAFTVTFLLPAAAAPGTGFGGDTGVTWGAAAGTVGSGGGVGVAAAVITRAERTGGTDPSTAAA